MNLFVTGGSGFIGRALLRELIEHGHTVRALAHNAATAATVASLGAEVVYGDILQRETLRAGMAGADAVFHLAGLYQLGGDPQAAEAINITGAHNVLSMAHELGVPRSIYLSTLAVYGDTGGRAITAADLEALTAEQRPVFRTVSEAAKWRAHYEVAVPLLRAGAPLIIVVPGNVYGPQDGGFVAEIMRYHYRRSPVLAAPETRLSLVHVDDLARGIRLAWEKGQVGRTYLLAGESMSLGEMFDLWNNLTGRNPHHLSIPGRWLRPLAPLVRRVERVAAVPPMFGSEAFALFGIRYEGDSTRAVQELGWEPRSLQLGMLETFRYMETLDERPIVAERTLGRVARAALLTLAGIAVYRRLAK